MNQMNLSNNSKEIKKGRRIQRFDYVSWKDFREYHKRPESELQNRLKNYISFVLKKVLPEETKFKKLTSKVLLEERQIKSWF